MKKLIMIVLALLLVMGIAAAETVAEPQPMYFETAAADETAAQEAAEPTATPEPEPYYLLPESDVRLYSRDELKDYDLETLGYMRNEILARHGYPFKKAHYQEYFNSQIWYEENPDFEYSMLNAIEMENVETIKKLEAKKK